MTVVDSIVQAAVARLAAVGVTAWYGPAPEGSAGPWCSLMIGGGEAQTTGGRQLDYLTAPVVLRFGETSDTPAGVLAAMQTAVAALHDHRTTVGGVDVHFCLSDTQAWAEPSSGAMRQAAAATFTATAR